MTNAQTKHASSSYLHDKTSQDVFGWHSTGEEDWTRHNAAPRCITGISKSFQTKSLLDCEVETGITQRPAAAWIKPTNLDTDTAL